MTDTLPFHPRTRQALTWALGITADELQRLVPPQIDVLNEALDGLRWTLQAKATSAWNNLHRAVGDQRGREFGAGWALSNREAMTTARRMISDDVALAIGLVAQATGAVEALDEGPQAVLDAEEERRGGWSRAFLVTDGHVHSSRRCPSCNRGEQPTRFTWMTEYSGKSHAEIIEAAADRACSVCYPDAPVNNGLEAARSVLLTPEEEKREALREEARIAAQAKKDKQAAGAIVDVDGERLRSEPPRLRSASRRGSLKSERRDAIGQGGDVIKSERTAKTELNQQAWYMVLWGDRDRRHVARVVHVARAVAKRQLGLTEPMERAQARMHPEIRRVAAELVVQARMKAGREIERERRRAERAKRQ